jgi:hypothetical protein
MDIDEIRKRISEIGKLAGNGLEENTKIIFQSLILLNGSGLVASLAFIGSILNSNFHTPYIPFVDVRPTVGGLFPELVLVNSHDGLSSYKLSAGLYRLICSNGLIAGENYKIIRVRHQGDVVGNVIEGSFEVMKSAEQLLQSADEMSSVQLTSDEKQIFAEAVHQLRFDGDLTLAGNAIKAEDFIRARRRAEQNIDDLFTVFNIAQENVIKGGLRGWAKDQNGYSKRVSTREIKSIDQSNALNKALWTLAEKMRELKKG